MNDRERVAAALRSVEGLICALRHDPCGRRFADVLWTGFGPLVAIKRHRKLTAAEMRSLVPAGQREVWDCLASDPAAITEYASGSGHLKVETVELHLLDWEESGAAWVARCRKCNADVVVDRDVLRESLRVPTKPTDTW